MNRRQAMKSLAASVAAPPFLQPEGYADVHAHIDRSFEAHLEALQNFIGGTEPLRGRDSRELFVREGEKVIAVPIAAEPLLKPREPRTPLNGDYILRAYRVYGYDRKSDRFLMAKLDESETDQKELEVVVTWFDELKRLAPPPSGR